MTNRTKDRIHMITVRAADMCEEILNMAEQLQRTDPEAALCLSRAVRKANGLCEQLGLAEDAVKVEVAK